MRDRAYINSLQQKIEENNTELTAWGSITARLLTLQNYATVLSQPVTFQARSVTSSNENIITATINGTPQVGLYPVKVYQLSQTHQLTSRGFQSTDEVVASADDIITIELGNGWVDKKTSLEWLNEQQGIGRGAIRIVDRSGNSATIDLTGALTIQDVIDAINENSDIQVTAEIDYDAGYNVGDAIKLTDTSGGSGNFIVDEVDGGTTAHDLGIYTGPDGVDSSVIHGEDINNISWETPLDLLNDGTGVYKGSIQITDRVGNVDVIDLSSATTLQDVKDLIEAAPNINVEVQINSNGNGITIHDLNASPTQDLIVDEVDGGTTAHDLGIYTTGVAGDRVGDRIIPGLNTILLKTLNGGNGVSSVTGDDFQITQRDGNSFNVDISGAETLQEVINLINSATGNTAVTASYDREGNGILLTDSSGGTGNFSVTALNGSSAASDLGILKSVDADTIEGDDLNPQYIARCTRLDDLNGGQGVDRNKILITDRSGQSAEVDLSSAETIGDVLDAINSASGIDVTASINSSGNGILITDNTGQTASPLKVEEAGGTTARDLNILQSTDSSTIDGSFEVSVTITSENTTLQGIMNAINDADAGVYASIINDGSGINPYHLVITSSRMGKAGRMVIDPALSTGKSLELTTTVLPQNAAIVIGEEGSEVLITDTSNQIDQAIPGVTLSLISADPDTTVNVSVEADIEGIRQAISNLIDAYNNLIDDINQQQSYDADTNQEGGPLFGKITLTNIRNQIVQIITNPVEGSSSITSIFELGITPDLTGHLNVNETTLNQILTTDLEGVKELFSANRNVALSSFGTTASASSTHSSGNFPVESVNNGETTSDNWGTSGGGWKDGTQSEFPDYLTLTFDQIRTLNKVMIYTLDSDTYPASTYGIKDYELQYLAPNGDPNSDDDWITYTTVTSNTQGVMTHYLFSVSTQAIRLKINDSNDGEWSRVIEFEAYQYTGIAGKLKDYLSYVTDSTTGLIATIEDSLQAQNEDYEERIETQEKLLQMKEEALWRQFTYMEQYLSVMQAQSTWLTQQVYAFYNLRSNG